MEKKLRDEKHKRNVVAILKFLALNGKTTAWNITIHSMPKTSIQNADRIVRRILSGRTDREKYSPGLIEDRVVTEEPSNKKEFYFELTFFGLLYSIKLCNFTSKELYQVAKNYEDFLPYVFGKHEYLKKNKVSLIPLKIFAEGKMSKLERSMQVNVHYQELFNYLNSQFPRSAISEREFRNYASYWFYSYLLWDFRVNKKMTIKKWHKIISNDYKIGLWYSAMITGALQFYSDRFQTTKQFLQSIQK